MYEAHVIDWIIYQFRQSKNQYRGEFIEWGARLSVAENARLVNIVKYKELSNVLENACQISDLSAIATEAV